MNPPSDRHLAARMNQWLQTQRTELDDGDLLALAGWLDGRLDGRQQAQTRDEVELLLAADPAWLSAALDLHDSGPEPVLADEILAAQALVVAKPRVSYWRKWLDGMRINLQPLPLAFAALLAVVATVGGLRMGEAAAIEFGVEDLQTASMLEVTQVDYGVNAQLAMNDAFYE